MVTFGLQVSPVLPKRDDVTQSNLYERDFHRWTEEQAQLLRTGAYSRLDIENLVDEVETLGRSVKREIESRLGVLCQHLLKWQFQPQFRSGSWRGTIVEQRFRLSRELKANPSLRNYPDSVLAEEYELSRTKAAGETGLTPTVFPSECPFTIDQILDPDFFPDAA